MFKKYMFLIILFVFLCMSSGMTEASRLLPVGSYSLKDMADSKSWSHVYKAGEGEFKIKISKLAKANVNQKYHLKVWKDGKLVSDGYCPSLGGYYEVQMFEDKDTGKFVFTLNTENLSRIFGYNDNTNKFCVLIDTRTCPGIERYPRFFTTQTGDLELFYTGTDEYASRYLLSYDAKNAKMTAENITKERPKPVVVEPVPEQTSTPVQEIEVYDHWEPPTYYQPSEPVTYEEEEDDGEITFTSNNSMSF